MTEPAKHPPLPAWAKIVLVLFVAGSATVVVLLLVAAAFVADLQKNARNPQRMAEVASHIARIDYPLPPDFSYEAAVPLFNWMSVILTYKPDRTIFYLVKMPNPNGVAASKLAEQFSKQSPSGLNPLNVSSSGKIMVGGQEMDYVQGSTADPTGSVEQEMLGVIVPNQRKESILIIGLTPGEKFNQQAADKLFSAIKGF